jgi:aminodeoxyfutalosine deaminase
VQFISANKIFDGENYLPMDAVLVYDEQHQLIEITTSNSVDSNNIKHYEGLLTPGFINAHCHLELSHLKSAIKTHTGIVGFAQQIIAQRSLFSDEEMLAQMQKADEEMWRNGIIAVGDISNTALSFEVKKRSNIKYHTFVELIGLNPEIKDVAFEKGIHLIEQLKAKGLSGSLSPHAPYSVSANLIKKIAEYNNLNNDSTSIHNQESEEENKFFKGEESDFYTLYQSLNIDISFFKPPFISSLQSYKNHLGKSNTLFVHNTFTSSDDLNSVTENNFFWCFCPKANLYIENKLPNFNAFHSKKDNLCLGTDSLASNTSLNILEEANLLLTSSNFKLETILRMLCLNGAKALGLENNFGKLLPKKATGLNLLKYQDNQLTLVKKIM